MPVTDFNLAKLTHDVRDRIAPFAQAVKDLRAFAAQIAASTPVRAAFGAGADLNAPHIDAVEDRELDPDAKTGETVGSVEHDGARAIYRSALCLLFDKAVKGRAAGEEIHFRKRSGGKTRDGVSYIGPPKERERYYNWNTGRYYDSEREDISSYARIWIVAAYDIRAPGEVRFTVRPGQGAEDSFGTDEANNHLPKTWALGDRHSWWSYYRLPLFDSTAGFRRETYVSHDGSLPQELQDDLLKLYIAGAQRGLLQVPLP